MPGGSTPILVLRGWLDPYRALAADVAKALNGYPNLSIVELPNASYNALGGSDCPRRIRNAWIDDLAPPSVDPTCETALLDLASSP